MERRRFQRKSAPAASKLRLSLVGASGLAREVEATLVDLSEKGMRVELPVSLGIGSTVSLHGSVLASGSQTAIDSQAEVRWCTANRNGGFQAGLLLQAANTHAASEPLRNVPEDYYDILQLSPKAAPDTIHRVFRLLAQRYHPDNAETGNADVFRQLLDAYQVLSDPQKRAAYDLQRKAGEALRWRVFSSPQATRGPEAEKRKRQAILMLLYTKRVNLPDQPAMTLREMEDLLGIPKEHMEFSLWYLKERGLATRGDSSRYQITVAGVDEAETDSAPARETPPHRLLPEANASAKWSRTTRTGPTAQ